MMMNNNRQAPCQVCPPASPQQQDARVGQHGPTLSLHDPEFRNLITVPLNAVHHLPPAHLEISRLVLCKKYDPRNPMSCPMGEACKFVHIDMNCPGMTVQSIHVNYAYRSLDEVKHERLPAGEMITVMAPNNRAPSQLVPSELILKTRGAENRHSGKGCNSHCAHYYYNRMCNRGERCSFLHCLYIDPNAGEFQRAPPRAGASVNAVLPQSQVPSIKIAGVSPTSTRASSMDLTESPRSQAATEEYPSSLAASTGTNSGNFNGSEQTPKRVYRHNPYSLMQVTLDVSA